MHRYAIFGGTGFIGTHLAQYILDNEPDSQIVLCDLLPPRNASYAKKLQTGLSDGRVRYIKLDVRSPISVQQVGQSATVINLAAIHREPGHHAYEYFETNIYGAKNVCSYASESKATTLIFTSSISVYGPTEEAKTESSLTVPETPYGASKLVAENIHRTWQSGAEGRRLLILRPGVIFGAGEGGNVTRLVSSVASRYIVYVGNQHVIKAGGYVKELCNVIHFLSKCQHNAGRSVELANFTMDPPRSMSDFVEAIQSVLGVKYRPASVPRTMLLALSYPIDALFRLSGIKQPISPTRIKKLYRSTNIQPMRLREMGYEYRYSLREALDDWASDCPTLFKMDVSRRVKE